MSEELKSMSFADKCKALLDVEKSIKGLADKAAQITSAKRDLEGTETSLREAIITEMSTDGVTQAEECGLVFAVQNSPRRIVVTDETQVPDEYFKTVRSLDKTKLNAAAKEQDIPGTALNNGGQILVIRAKGRK